MRLDAASATWPEVRDHLAAGSGLAILPFGALEQHGSHLPLSTDTLTAVAVAERIADRVDALLLPAVPYGETWNMSGYPGTMSLSPATVTAAAVDLGRAASASGARGLVVVNGDWGNRAPLQVAVRRLADEGIEAIALDHPGLDAAAAALRVSAPATPGLMHAEEIETSLLRHIAPEQVRTGSPRPVYPDFPADFGVRPMRLHPFSASGVFGDPGPATAATGAVLLEAVVAASLPILEAFVAALPARDPLIPTAAEHTDGVRAFRGPDTEQVIALWQRCGLVRPRNDPSRDIERKRLVQPELFLVLESARRIVATAMGGYDGHRGWVYYLAVAPERQGAGLGRRMMRALEDRLLRLGCPKVNVQVRQGNDAVAGFYERLGYRPDDAAGLGKRLIPDA